MGDIEFIPGLTFKGPNERAPEYVKCTGGIRVTEMMEWLATKDQGSWVNFQVKVSNGGKWYASVDNWKPTPKGDAPAPAKAKAEAFGDEEIPF